MYSVVITADMGESFGRYKLGNDEELMKYVTTANLACGFHAGDPTVMRTTVALARKYDVAVGAHPGFQDLRGFGRRMIDITPEEMADDVLYQLGALEAFLKVEGMKLQHVFPHGMLDPLVSYQEKHGEAFMKTIQDYNPELIIMLEAKCPLYKMAKSAGLRVAAFAAPDLKYDSSDNIVIERAKKPADPAEVAQQAVSIVKDHKLKTIDGEELELRADVLCFHGDAPNSAEVLKQVRQEFEKEGINVTRW
jgi:UPF0271 protein